MRGAWESTRTQNHTSWVWLGRAWWRPSRRDGYHASTRPAAPGTTIRHPPESPPGNILWTLCTRRWSSKPGLATLDLVTPGKSALVRIASSLRLNGKYRINPLHTDCYHLIALSALDRDKDWLTDASSTLLFISTQLADRRIDREHCYRMAQFVLASLVLRPTHYYIYSIYYIIIPYTIFIVYSIIFMV